VYYGHGFHNGPVPLRQLVKVHPETGRKSLVIGRHAYGIPRMNRMIRNSCCRNWSISRAARRASIITPGLLARPWCGITDA
jgi:hypothetical protein